jgi:hypothetical protein
MSTIRSVIPVNHETDDRAIAPEPDEEIRLLGRMVGDAEHLAKVLRELPVTSSYLSDLRTMLSISRRMAARTTRLIEATEPGRARSGDHVALVEDYLEDHPGATWKDAVRAVLQGRR